VPHPKVKIADNGGNEVGVTDNRLNVNVAGATMSTGDIEVNSEFPDAASITDDFANPATTSVMSMGMAYEGSTWDRLTSTGSKLNICLHAADGTTLSETSNALDVNVASGSVTVNTISGFATSTNQLAAGHTIDCNSTFVKLKDGSGTAVTSNSGKLDVCLHSEDGTAINETSNALDVNIASSATLSVNSHAVTNAGTFVVQEDGAALTALQLIDDAIYVDDADFTLNLGKGIAIMGYSGNNDITAGDIGIIALTDTGHVKTVANLGDLDTFAMIDVDNAAEQLSATVGTLTDCIEMFFQADESNSGYVIVGDSDVEDNRGMKLNAGDTLILSTDDTRNVYLWGSADNQNVRCMLSRF